MVELSTSSFVKICGITRPEDAEVVVGAGADALGLIFASSARRVTVEQAQAVAKVARGKIMIAAVFREQSNVEILETLDGVGVDLVQLHGTIDEALVDALRVRDVRVVKALGIGTREFSDFDDALVDAVLIDGASPGSGIAHAWDELTSRTFRVPIVAAGGLTPDSVADVIRDTGVWGVDVASGVESAPGVKDRTLVEQFVERARLAMTKRGSK